jgi:hypothetical protein
VLEECERQPRARLAAGWLEHIKTLDPLGPAEEAEARRCAALYTAYLQAARDHGGLHRLQPGRFLLPGELEGSPALTFSPLKPPAYGRAYRGTLWELMESRFEAYKDRIIRPFFREHFARIDRQIVLVDLLQALNVGAYSVDDLTQALGELLETFKPGRNSWLWPILGRRVERVLFAATKADHVPAGEHDRLAGLLNALLFASANRAAFQGAEVETMAIASVRATREAQARQDGALLDCVEGRPLEGGEPVVAFPGELPATREDIAAHGPGHYGFVAFRPPAAAGRDGRGLPHLRLDRALEFLIGDLLA